MVSDTLFVMACQPSLEQIRPMNGSDMDQWSITAMSVAKRSSRPIHVAEEPRKNWSHGDMATLLPIGITPRI